MADNCGRKTARMDAGMGAGNGAALGLILRHLLNNIAVDLARCVAVGIGADATWTRNGRRPDK